MLVPSLKLSLIRNLQSLYLPRHYTWIAISRDEGDVFVIAYGSSRRVGPSNEAVTGKGDGKMDGVDEEKEGGSVAAAAALCVATLKVRYGKQYIPGIYKLDMELKLVLGTAYRKPKDRL